jgi:hypothetical protein
MKHTLTLAAVLALGAVASTALAGETPPAQKAPTKTMGDEGKLPATSTTDTKVPEMGSDSSQKPVQDDGSKRMGDEGKLPATATGSKNVPDMTAPSK